MNMWYLNWICMITAKRLLSMCLFNLSEIQISSQDLVRDYLHTKNFLNEYKFNPFRHDKKLQYECNFN